MMIIKVSHRSPHIFSRINIEYFCQKPPPRISQGFNLPGHNDIYAVKDVWRAKEHLCPAAVLPPCFTLKLITVTAERLLEYREAIVKV